MSLQSALNAYIDHGSTEQGLTLHNNVKCIPNTALQNSKQASSPPSPSGNPGTLAKRQKTASPKHTPGPSSLSRKAIVNPFGSGSTGQLPASYDNELHYAEITVTHRNSPPTPMTPTKKQSVTLPRNLTLPNIRPDELEEDYVEMRHNCASEGVQDGRVQNAALPSPSPSPSLRAADPYTRALIEENKRLRTSITHYTQKVASLEREKAELELKVRKLEADVSSGPISPQDGSVGMVGNSPTRVPVPELLPQSLQQQQQQQEEAREYNVSYLGSLDDDQVRGGRRGGEGREKKGGEEGGRRGGEGRGGRRREGRGGEERERKEGREGRE